jgi:hypothetical protein
MLPVDPFPQLLGTSSVRHDPDQRLDERSPAVPALKPSAFDDDFRWPAEEVQVFRRPLVSALTARSAASLAVRAALRSMLHLHQ